MGNYIKKYDLGTIKVDLPFYSHIHELPLLHFKDFRGSVDISLIYNQRLVKNNIGNIFNIMQGYKLNIEKRIIIENSKLTKYIDYDGSIVELINNNGIYSFKDNSKRIIRIVSNGFELEYSDFSKEVYDNNGYLKKVIDKYDDEVLTFEYNNHLLISIMYRNVKKIEFIYENSNKLCQIKYGGTITILEYLLNIVSVKHYSQVTYITKMENNTYSVTAADSDNLDNVIYIKKCQYNTDKNDNYRACNIKLSYIDGTTEIDYIVYKYLGSSNEIGDVYHGTQMIDLLNKKGIGLRCEYDHEKLLYSYEIFEKDNGYCDPLFNDISYEGTVNIYDTKNTQKSDMESIALPRRIIKDYTIDEITTGVFRVNISKAEKAVGYYLLTGWIKSDNLDTIGFKFHDAGFNITPEEYENCNFYVPINVTNTWHFFAYKFYGNWAQKFLNTNAGMQVEFKDIRITYQTTEFKKDDIIYSSLKEPILIKTSDLSKIGTEYTVDKINFNDLKFYIIENGAYVELENMRYNDILRNKLKSKKDGFINSDTPVQKEIYFNDSKEIKLTTSKLFFLLNGNYFDIDEYCIGTRYYNMGKEYWSYVNVGASEIVVEEMINNKSCNKKTLNNYLDTIYEHGIKNFVHYTRDKGLLTYSIVNNDVKYRNWAEYHDDYVVFIDEFLKRTTQYIDSTWGTVTKVVLPNGAVIEDTYDDDKSAIKKISYLNDSSTIDNNFYYLKGNLSSISSGDLKYDYSYNKGKNTKIEKYQNDTSTPKFTLQEMIHNDNITTINYPNLFSLVYEYDKYDRLLSIDGVLKNTYDVEYNNSDVRIANSTSLLVEQEDKLTGITSYRLKTVEINDNEPKDYIERRNQSGEVVSKETYELDEANRLVLDTFETGVNLQDKYISSIEYDTSTTNDYIDDKIKKYTYKINNNNCCQSEYNFDDLKRITSKTDSMNGRDFIKSYTYNKTRISSEANAIGESQSYVYDDLGRISNIYSTNNNRKYYYDLYGRLIREDNQLLDKTYTYEYNEIGNIVSKKTYNYTTSDTLPTNYSTTNYTYDTVNSDRLISCGTKTLAYNGLGYPTSYNGYSLNWNKGKLVSMLKGNRRDGSESYTFQYNALGQRTQKKYTKLLGTSGVTSITPSDIINSITTYEYDNQGRLIKEEKSLTYYSDGTDYVKIEYIYDQNSIIGMRYTNDNVATLYYFNRNIFGDVTEIYNTSGVMIAKYVYDAYGNCTIKQYTDYTIAKANPIRYRGYYYDVETQLYWVSSRYYSPELCRWISPDSIEYLDPQSINGLNLYAYCGNDPVNNVDPSGHFPIAALLIGIGLGALFGGITAGVSSALDGNTGWALVGDILGGALIGATTGAAFTLGGLAGVGMIGTKAAIIGFGVSTVASFGAGVGANVLQSTFRGENIDWNEAWQDGAYTAVQSAVCFWVGASMSNMGAWRSLNSKAYSSSISLFRSVGQNGLRSFANGSLLYLEMFGKDIMIRTGVKFLYTYLWSYLRNNN